MSATTIARLLLFLPDALAAYDAPQPVLDRLARSTIHHVSILVTRLLLSLPDALAAFSDGPPSPSRAALSAPPYATWLSLPHALEPCVVAKHAKAPSPENQSQIAISSADGDRSKGLVCTVQRTSGLEAPIDGPEHRRAAHGLAKAPITDLQWSLVCSPTLYTVSANASLTATDVRMGQRVRRVRAAHRGVINALGRTMGGGSGAELVATAADNNTVRVCDMSEDGGKLPIAEWDVGCPVTAACWSKDGASMYAAALDNEIHVYDLRSSAALHTLGGHTDTPTSLALLPM
ncbi:WD40-repeat-containing domain protein [Mycena sp. CBHHK59/15]|nr:WD40-repeat-containing domain protein [Mycena sp. CBHHK59/15]